MGKISKYEFGEGSTNIQSLMQYSKYWASFLGGEKDLKTTQILILCSWGVTTIILNRLKEHYVLNSAVLTMCSVNISGSGRHMDWDQQRNASAEDGF